MARIDPLLDDLLARGGNALHVAAACPPMVRVRGDLVPLRDAALSAQSMDEILFELVPPDVAKRLRDDLDADFSWTHGDKARFRVNCFYKRHGLSAVFQLLPSRVLSLAELGCPEVLWRLADKRFGLILVTGPAGSGKTTTMAAMVDHINKTRAGHIVTLEAPLELVHEPLRSHVTHREIGRDAPTFELGLESAANESADVVLCSDLASSGAMRRALALACSGVLVIGSGFAGGAVSTLERIVASFPVEEQPHVRGLLAESLAGIVTQQMLRTADGKGRLTAHEILIGTPPAAAFIHEGRFSQLTSVMQAGQGVGMQTMEMSLERLMTAGRIAPEVALERAYDREAFARIVSRLRPDLAEPAV